MKSATVVAALAGVAMAAPSVLSSRAAAAQTAVNKMVINEKTLLKGTYTGKTKKISAAKIKSMKASKGFSLAANPGSLPFEFVNNFDGGNVKAYISGTDSDGQVVFITKDGGLIYPSAEGAGEGDKVPVNDDDVAIPLGEKGSTLKVTMPITLTSGRIYFAEGGLTFAMTPTANGGQGLVQPSVTNFEDPSINNNWGFVELTYTHDTKAIYANVSYVDFIGMLLSMKLTVTDDGGDQVTQGLAGDSIPKICDDLAAQKGSDGRDWDKLCYQKDGAPLRILNPTDYFDVDPNAFGDYFDDYVNQVYEKYAGEDLTINTQRDDLGQVKCRANGDSMTCDNDPKPWDKPNSKDIFGCDSGPFHKEGDENDTRIAIIPRICAAFNRATFLLDGGNTQPGVGEDSYYTVDPNNHYSRIVHKYEVDHRGYAFSYDDVNPDTSVDQSGIVSSGAPDTLQVTFGGPIV